MENPSPEHLVHLIVDPPANYWKRGSGDALLDFEERDGTSVSLLILPNESLGYFLKFLKFDGVRVSETWLSLWDRQNLDKVVECSDEWMASVGLFLPAECAAEVVSEFARTGARASSITWIRPSDLPPEGNC
jgi:hypothetical protein